MNVFIRIGAALSSGFRSSVSEAVNSLNRIGEGAGGLSGRLIDVGQAFVGLHGLGKAVHGAGDLEQTLTEIGITAGLSAERIEGLRQKFRHLSGPGETNQFVEKLAQAFKLLVSAGMDADKAEAALFAIGRSATAASADIGDIANMASTLVDTMKISPENLGREIARLSYAGKMGAFEMKDMARYFPVLGAAAKEAGLVGSEGVATLGAALQAARKGAGDSSEAANNMKNFLSKMLAPETIKNMAKHGVNVTKLMADAMKSGQNSLEVYLKKLDSMLGTDQVKRKARLGSLFGDMQAQDFIRPMLERLDSFGKDKAEIMGAVGTIDEDYVRMLSTFNQKAEGAANAVGKLGDSIGRSLLPPLGVALGLVTPVISGFSDWADGSPGVTLALTSIGAALVVLPPILRTVAFAARFAAVGFRGLGLAMVGNPIGLALMGIALAAGLIYDNWGVVMVFFENFFAMVAYRANEIVETFQKVGATISETFGKVKSYFGFGEDQAPAPPTGVGWAGTARSGPGASPGPSLGAATVGAQQASAAPPTGQVDVTVKLDGLPRSSTTETKARGAALGEIDTHTCYQMAVP